MKKNAQYVEHVCCVDSVSDGVVRLLIGTYGENVHYFPLELFPEGIKEGVWLDITISLNDNAAEKGKRDVADLYSELLSGSE